MADDHDAMRAELAKAGRAYLRAQKLIREDFPALIRRAHDSGMRNADIARATEHAITPERVRQIVTEKRAE